MHKTQNLQQYFAGLCVLGEKGLSCRREQFSSVKSEPECTFHKPSNGPLQGGAWQGPCGQSGYFEWGEGCVCHFPGMLPCWSGQCSGQLVSQCYKPGDTAGHLHLRMAKKSKKGNPTPFTHGKEVQKRKFDSTKTMADKFKSWKYDSTMAYAICIYYIFQYLVSCKGNTNIHRPL